MMGPFKKHLTPIHKGGQIDVHRGKGARPFPQPKPGPLMAGAPSMNNYAKTPALPTPPPPPMGASPLGGAPPDTMTGQDQGMV